MKIVALILIWLVVAETEGKSTNIPSTKKKTTDWLGLTSMIAAAAAGMASLLAPICKCRAKRRKRQYYQVQREIKFKHMIRGKEGIFCSCGHQHTKIPHVVGHRDHILRVFPDARIPEMGHAHKGLTFACLLASCSADIFVPANVPVVTNVRNISIQRITVDLSPPSIKQSHEIWDRGFVGDIVGLTFYPNYETHGCKFVNGQYSEPKKTVSIPLTCLGEPIKGPLVLLDDVNSMADPLLCVDNYPAWRQIITTQPQLGQAMIHKVDNRTFYCVDWGQTSCKLRHPQGLARPSKMLRQYYCPNFNLQVRYDDGSFLWIYDVLNNQAAVEKLILSQGLEIRATLEECKTKRCIAVRTMNQHRVKRGAHCGALIFYSYCPEAMVQEDVETIVSTFMNKQSQILQKGIKGTATQVIRLAQLVESTHTEGIERMTNVTIKFNTELSKSANAHNKLRKDFRYQQIKRSTQATLRDLKTEIMTSALAQRLLAVELVNQYRFNQELFFAALECAEERCTALQSLLSSLDFELVQLKRADYPFYATVHFGQELTILYSKPADYDVKFAYLPYKPRIAIALGCDGRMCESCVIQRAEMARVNYAENITDLQGMKEVKVTAFEIQPCMDQNQPAFQIIPIGHKCLKVAIDASEETACPPEIKLQHFAAYNTFSDNWMPKIDYFSEIDPPLNLYVKTEDEWNYVDMMRTSLVTMDITDELERTQNEMDTSLGRLSTSQHVLTDSTIYTRTLAIIAIALASLTALITLLQIICLRRMWHKPAPQIAYHKTNNTATALAINQPKTTHLITTYSATLLDGDTAIFTIHGNEGYHFTQVGPDRVTFITPSSPNAHSAGSFTNLKDFVVLATAPCDCTDEGIIQIIRIQSKEDSSLEAPKVPRPPKSMPAEITYLDLAKSKPTEISSSSSYEPVGKNITPSAPDDSFLPPESLPTTMTRYYTRQFTHE